MNRLWMFTVMMITCVLCGSHIWADGVNLACLRCEYRDNPLGIDAAKPRLSWKIEGRDQMSEVRSQKQSAYQFQSALPEPVR